MKFKICMHLPITAVLPGENTDSIENSEDNLACQMHVTVYWERKINETRRYCNSL